MARARRLVLAALAACVASVAIAACYEDAATSAAFADFGKNIPADTMARIRSAEIDDGIHDSIRLARVLVPFTVLAVWWRGRRKERPR